MYHTLIQGATHFANIAQSARWPWFPGRKHGPHLRPRGVQVDSTTTTEQFQRVFFWRWRAPEGQTTFTLHIPELERVYQEAQAELAEELDRDDDLQPAPQQVLPYPGLQQIGGNYGRSQPQQALLVACAPPVPSRRSMWWRSRV